ncbi:paraquat-inducible protein B [Zhongshania antarctica]|uniref:Paraquat-inducible protein B n=1 Tax=Zhongshania antarctica TaxID=641702 RepID=A0A840R2D4_9GAMM|nr:MlaD family protein [Zhongshania antarctica]MBB5186798.1 paraquat-inducible protein B [Zhongshania antarctica]
MIEDNIRSAHSAPKRSLSAIWLLPLIALAVAAWLLYQNINNTGLRVTVAFDNGSGISVGKTPVMYQGINVGQVTSLQLDDDLEGVTATIELSEQIAPLIRENTAFWLVKPQISLSGVSGLDTLVAGNYISFKPGDGEPTERFTALIEPPPMASNLPGLRLVLEAESLGSLSVGAPILYQQIDVGDIESYQLSKNGIEANVRIDPQYQHLVNSSSRFWQQSGLKVNAGLQGIDIDAGSIASILAGGIAFETPAAGAEAVDNNTRFRLFTTKERAKGSKEIVVYFRNPDGLTVGSNVRLLGMDIGKVESLSFVDNNPNLGANITLTISAPHHQYLNTDSQFWLVKPEVSSTGVSGLDALLGGPYIAMRVSGKGGAIAARYTALFKAPDSSIQQPGLRLSLRSDELNSVGIGTKIYYRKIAVGQVESIELDANGVNIGAFIHQRYAHLVHRESQFWNASGISISGGLSGLDIRADSLATIVAGGIAFHTPDVKKPQLAWEGLRYSLHPDYQSTFADKGRDIFLYFDTGSNINKGTEIKYQGIKVGEVITVELDTNMEGVKVSARLAPSAKALARSGSQFWVVRPQLGLIGTRNLETLVTGSYISVRPGYGTPQTSFAALDKPPPLSKPSTGLNLIVAAPQRGSIKEGVKVFYRDIPVGEVFGYELADDATQTLMHINIESRYAGLVRENSVFWNSSGIAVKFGLFSGATIRSKSIESLLEGGIAFATPDSSPLAPQVISGMVFPLRQNVEQSWLDWTPSIPLPREADTGENWIRTD